MPNFIFICVVGFFLCSIGLPLMVLGSSVLSKGLRLVQLELNLVRLVRKLYIACQEHAYGKQNYSKGVTTSRHDNKTKEEYFVFLIKVYS